MREYERRELVERHGQWDPSLDAYVVERDGRTRYFAWTRRDIEIEFIAVLVIVLFWIGVAALVLSVVVSYPEGVAGDRRAQLAQALRDKYAVAADYLPGQWGDTQVFTVDIEQGWDDPEYDQPETVFEACRLQPGASARDLSLQCRDATGTRYEEVREGGRSARQEMHRQQWLEEFPELDGSYDPGADDDYFSRLMDDYEQEVYP